MRVAVVVLVALASMALGLQSAEAIATTLLHPTSIRLVRGSSSQTNAEAVGDVDQQDGVNYDVSSRRRDGVNAVIFTFVVNNAQPNVIDLTDQWNGTVTSPCRLRLSLWNFQTKRWASKSFGSIDPAATDVFSFPVPQPARFIRGTTIRGRVACTSTKRRFKFSTDRIRLPEDSNP